MTPGRVVELSIIDAFLLGEGVIQSSVRIISI